MRRSWAASLPPILDTEGRPDRDAFFVRLAISWNCNLLFVNALFGRGVKHLIRPGAVRILGSRAFEQAVRAVAAFFEEHTVFNWKPFFIRALFLKLKKKAFIKMAVYISVLSQKGLTVAVLSKGLQASP